MAAREAGYLKIGTEVLAPVGDEEEHGIIVNDNYHIGALLAADVDDISKQDPAFQIFCYTGAVVFSVDGTNLKLDSSRQHRWNDEEKLLIACLKGDIEVALHLCAGHDLGYIASKSGATQKAIQLSPLAAAVQNNHAELLQAFLLRATDANQLRSALGQATHCGTLRQKRTLLGIACCADSVDCARVLLEAGADLYKAATGTGHEHPDASGRGRGGASQRVETPLHAACYEGSTRCVRLLLEAKAETQPRGKDGYQNRPLHFAAGHGCAEIVTALLQAGADVDGWYDEPTQTPLYCACFNGRLEVVRRLLEMRADPTLKHSNGSWPMDVVGAGRQITSEVGTNIRALAVDATDEAMERKEAAKNEQRKAAMQAASAQRTAEEEAAEAQRQAEETAAEAQRTAKRAREKAKKEDKLRRRQLAKERACAAAGMPWEALEAVLNTSLDLEALKAAVEAVSEVSADLPSVDVMSARERLERLERAETLAVQTAANSAAPHPQRSVVTATLVRGELLADSPELVYHDQRCGVCLETFVDGLRERCVAVLSCHHAICSACLVDLRMQT